MMMMTTNAGVVTLMTDACGHHALLTDDSSFRF